MTPEEIKALEARVAKAEASATKAEENQAALIAAGNSGSGGGHRSGSSDEQRALRYFGAKGVKELLEVNTGSPRFADVPPELKRMVVNLKEDFDVSRLTQQIIFGEARDQGDNLANVKGILDGNYHARNVLAPKLKAFGSTVVGGGDEWVPTMVSSQFIEEFELDRQVIDQFKAVNMPSSPFDLPVQTGVTVARKQAESANAGGITNANFTTGKITMLATKLVESMALPEELNEDSAVQILSLCRSEVTEAQARAWEIATINGDTAVTHQDFDVTAVEDAQKAWDGLRKLAIANSATVNFLGAAVTTPLLRSMRTQMGKFGVSERNLVWMVSSKTYQQMIGLPEVTTVDKFGQMATILRGALSALDGIPIVISSSMRDNLSATGVNTVGGPNTFSSLMLVNRSRFFWGTRRPIRVRASMDPTPPSDRWLLASWWRGDFKGHAQGAGETSVVLGRNIG